LEAVLNDERLYHVSRWVKYLTPAVHEAMNYVNFPAGQIYLTSQIASETRSTKQAPR